MLPSQFWEEEPADVLLYIEAATKQKQTEQYNTSLITAQMQAINLANSFREKGARPTEYPTIYEVFGWDDPNKIDPFELRKQQLRARLQSRRKQA